MKRTDIARFLPAAVLLASGLARGAGFEFPDDGAEALGRSGAFAAKADDGTAIYYNPSALADQKGLNILVDSEFINNSVNFQRTDSLGTAIGPAVQNSGGTFIDPFVAVSYQILPRLTLALGIYGPPADGRYQFPGETPPAFNSAGLSSPNGSCLIGFCPQPGQTPGAYTSPPEGGPGPDPQKYNLISDNIFIAYPTLSVAWAPIDIIAVGVSAQMVYASTQISQATFDGALFENGKHLTTDEVPIWDTIANLNVSNSPVREYTGILGVTIKPPVIPLRIGASYRPGFSIVQNGTMTLDYSTVMQYGGGKPATVTGKGTQQAKDNSSGSGPVEFDLPMPGEFKSGVDWSFGGGSDLELDFDYTQWSQVGKIYTTPNFGVVANGATTPLPALTQLNDFQDTWALRLGGDWKLPVPLVRLAVRAGLSYESSVYPSSGTIYPQLSFPNFQMYAGAVGLTAGLGPVDIVLAYSHVYEPTEDVRNAGTPMTQNVSAGSAAPPTVVVGNGNYTTSYDVVAAGVRIHFL